MAIDNFPAFGRNPCEEIGSGGVQANAFLDAGYEVGQVAARFFVQDGGREMAGAICFVDFRASASKYAGSGGYEAQDGSERGAGRVGSSLDEESDVRALL